MACWERGASTESGGPRGLFGERVGVLRTRERAVILTAVQSLRLLVRRGVLRERRAGAACSEGLVGRRACCDEVRVGRIAGPGAGAWSWKVWEVRSRGYAASLQDAGCLVGIYLGCYPRLVYVVPLGQVDEGEGREVWSENFEEGMARWERGSNAKARRLACWEGRAGSEGLQACSAREREL
jgi:hypothetical protein